MRSGQLRYEPDASHGMQYKPASGLDEEKDLSIICNTKSKSKSEIKSKSMSKRLSLQMKVSNLFLFQGPLTKKQRKPR